MIKGIISLFTSGAIFNPMVLLGIFLAIFAMIKMTPAEMEALFKNYHLYLLVLLISFVYTFTMKKVYKDNGTDLDFTAMALGVLGGVLKFVLACFLMIAFVVMLSF